MDAAKTLADFVIKYGIGRSELLATYLDLKGKKSSGKALVGELGDFAPFFYWLGQVDNNRKYMEWAEDQTNLAISRAQLPSGIFTFFDAGNTRPSAREKMSLLRILDMDDAALGLVLMYELTRKLEYAKAAKRFFEGVQEFATEQGFVCTHIVPYINLRVPLSLPNYCGLLIEEMCRYQTLTNDETFLPFAEQLAKEWLKTPSFVKFGLFTFQPLCGRSSPSSFLMNLFLKLRTNITLDTAVMFKPNTNLVLGLVALHERTKDPALEQSILKWLASVQRRMMCGDVFYSSWDTRMKRGSMISLETNHGVIDVLLEIYVNLGCKDALEIAAKCADGWLERQSDCGLVPEGMKGFVFSPFRKSSRPYSPNISRLDSQTDFSIVLAKLYELTNDPSYLKASTKILEGILEWHKFEDGYCEFVSLVTKEKFGYKIETKFLTLLIKALLLHHENSKRVSIYDNRLLRNLIRDR